jgi:hypothetical protein
LDYLDAIWRTGKRGHLFTYPSAERTAKLSYDANTYDELDSQLSALAEILRSANRGARAATTRKLVAARHDRPLAPLEDYLKNATDVGGRQRVDEAVGTLEDAIAIRDAAQHAEAGSRAAKALDALGIGHPIVNPSLAWMSISSRVVEALDSIREELASRE